MSLWVTHFSPTRQPAISVSLTGGGQVDAIHYGPRRVLREIVIRRDAENEPVKSLGQPLDGAAIDRYPRAELVAHLLAGGVWPLLRALPYRGIADPEQVPPAIFVSLDRREPFQVPPARYLESNRALFELGLRALKRLCPTVYVHADNGDRAFCEAYQDLITHTVNGRYPADDPGVLLFHVRRTPEENAAWFIDGQDVLLMAQLLQSGQYPTARLFAVAGTGRRNRAMSHRGWGRRSKTWWGRLAVGIRVTWWAGFCAAMPAIRRATWGCTKQHWLFYRNRPKPIS